MRAPGAAFANIPGVREERPQSASEPDEPDRADEIVAEAEPSFFADPKRLIQTAIAVVLLLVAIYVLVPRLFDLQDALDKIGEGDPVWIALGVVFCVGMFAAYVALFRGVVGEKVIHLEWSESYQITMAGLAATRLFSAGGAGGILLTYWALRKAGMERAPVGLPDGRLPRGPLLRLPRRAGDLRGPAAHRRALRRGAPVRAR